MWLFAAWLIAEQVAVAAMDTRALELALELIKEIRRKFPDSQRSLRLTVRLTSLPAIARIGLQILEGLTFCMVASKRLII